MDTMKKGGMMAAAVFLLLSACEDRPPAVKVDGDGGGSERDAAIPGCTVDTDCNNFQICRDNVCVPEPDSGTGGAGGSGGSGGEGGSSGSGGAGGGGGDMCDPPCPPGFRCSGNRCIPDVGNNPGCDEEGAAPCPPGTVCDVSADQALCRPGDGTCDDICDTERGVCIDGVCEPFCFVQEGVQVLPERCCDEVNESCCRCDGTPDEQAFCDRDVSLCPLVCDCVNILLCTVDEWAVCEGARCDCSDPARVGNCPDDAACRCDCGNDLYRRFCAPEQCEAPPPECDCADRTLVTNCRDDAGCRCDCEDPLYARFCAEGQCSPPPPVCSCADRATVHLCGNDAGCMCICGDADYGRFCSAEECMGPPPVCDCRTGQNCNGSEGCACDCANPAIRRLFCSVDDCAPECDCRTGSNCNGTEGCACNCELPVVRQLFCSVEACMPECDCNTGLNCNGSEGCACDCANPTIRPLFCTVEQCNPPPECDCSTGANCNGTEGCVCQCEQSPAAQALFCTPVQRGDSDGDGIADICDPVCNLKVAIRVTEEGLREVVLTQWSGQGLGEGCRDYGLLRFTGDPPPPACNDGSVYCNTWPAAALRNRWDAFSSRVGALFAPLYGRVCMDNAGTQGDWTSYPYAIIYTHFQVGNACTVAENPGYLNLEGEEVRYGGGLKLCRRVGDVNLAPLDIACPDGYVEIVPPVQ